MEPEGSLPHPQEPATCSYPEHFTKATIINWIDSGLVSKNYVHDTKRRSEYFLSEYLNFYM
jgi:hypothetical protein